MDVRDNGGAVSPERSTNAFRSGNERLYEAYNDLHSLAQDFEKPFDAPAILVVGHQTDGKSGKQNLSTNKKSLASLAVFDLDMPLDHLRLTTVCLISVSRCKAMFRLFLDELHII